MPNWSGSDRKKAQKAKAKGPAWQGTASKGTRPRSSAQWKASGQPAKDPEARSRAVRALLVVASLVLLAGFLYLVLTWPKATPLISFKATTYSLQMPPLAFAEEDVNLLARA